MRLAQFEDLLNQKYQTEDFRDAIANGLLVEGTSEITRGVTAVSFSRATVEMAIEEKADFLVVHHAHGFWNNQPRVITGAFKEKVSLLLQHHISLFGFHLPMDAHPQLGNNRGVLQVLGLSKAADFLPHGKQNIGVVGEFPQPIHFSELLQKVKSSIGPVNFHFPYGNTEISKVAICTGGAASSIAEAKKTGAQVFLTGEAKEDTFIYCQDEKFNFIAAGHGQTERFGPELLANWITQYCQIPTKFIGDLSPV